MKSLRENATEARRWFVGRTFSFWERHGVHVTLADFYSAIPDTRALAPSTWTDLSELPGLDLRDDAQIALVEELTATYWDECAAFASERGPGTPAWEYVVDPIFSHLDAAVLHSMVRHLRPKRVIEIGSGASTLCTAGALRANHREDGGDAPEFTAIEPYPNETLRGGVPGLTRLIDAKVQDVPVETFMALAAGDILFIDSTHVLAVGSDVRYELLEIVPRLRPGVVVHFHDILLPGAYHEGWLKHDHTFWNEQYALQAFLAFNDRFEIVWASRYLHLRHPEVMAKHASPIYRPGADFSSSFWIRRTS